MYHGGDYLQIEYMNNAVSEVLIARIGDARFDNFPSDWGMLKSLDAFRFL